jgi:hypothetical protein
MTDIRKRLFGPAQLTNAAQTKYTVPSNTLTVVKYIRATNPTGAPVSFTMSIGVDAAGTRIYDAVSIPAGGAIEQFCMHVLNAAEVLQAFASVNTAVVLTLDGIENVLG